MQNISLAKQDPAARARKLAEAKVLLGFAMQVCELQHEMGQGFSFEHPKQAGSWKDEDVDRVRKLSGVVEAVFDQCCFGLRDPENGLFYKKGTKVITNNTVLGQMLKRVCPGNHDHQTLEGKIRVGGRWVCRTEVAQIYPKELCETFVKAIKRWISYREHDVLVSEALEGKHEKIQESILRCHTNLGHPSQERFLHMLKSAGASEEAIKQAKQLKCSVCAAKKPPVSHPVVKINKVEGFNQHIGMDTFEMKLGAPKVKKVKFLNVVCMGTGLQVVVPLWKGATSDQVRKLIVDTG